MDPIDLAAEMAAARQRREEKTARLLREARAQALRATLPPGSPREVVEELAHSFYPRLSPELLQEAIDLVCATAPRTQLQYNDNKPAVAAAVPEIDAV